MPKPTWLKLLAELIMLGLTNLRRDALCALGQHTWVPKRYMLVADGSRFWESFDCCDHCGLIEYRTWRVEPAESGVAQ
jgi:hypothetical protein